MDKLLLFVFVMLWSGCAVADQISIVQKPAMEKTNDYYVSNKAPLLPSPLVRLPVGAVRPAGWLKNQLRLQADGFHGHLTEISRFLRKENNAWLSKEGVGEWGWEEVPYWLKGFGITGYILDDAAMIKEAKLWIEGAFDSQKADGWFGPDKGRGGLATRLKGREDLWPNMIMLFCLQDYYDYFGDQRVLKLMENYFKYLMTVPEEKFVVGYWPKMRAADLLYSVLWFYNRTGDKALLELAHKVHRQTARWDEDVINWHNVNMGQAFGGPSTYYQLTRDPGHLAAAERNWQKMRDMYGQVPGGMFGGDENCRPGYVGPRQAIETCGVVEMMLSHETLLQISGDLKWADRCEDVTFNSLPPTTTADMKALRYLTAPNMILSDRHSKSPGIQNGGPMYLMNPHFHRCCQHNMGHGWPYFVQHLWMATPDNGLAAVVYSPCHVKARVGDGTEVVITEETRYPFEETITFKVKTPKPVAFPLYLRVPAWCRNGTVQVNDGAKTATQASRLMRVERTWSDGDKVTLAMNAEVSMRVWDKNHGSVSVDRGPLTYSLKIKEKYVRQGGTEEWPAWEIHPDSPWNYGLVLSGDDPSKIFKVKRKDWPASGQPFEAEASPIELVARGKRIPEWKKDHLGLVGRLQPSPVKTDQPAETLTLIPMGAARLRICSFPVIGDGSDAHKWQMPPKPKFSHCFGGDTPEALWDGKSPSSSNDHSIPRFTWWDHRGSKEWVQYDLKKAQTISSVSVYWFDDTGIGGCRVPESWEVQYRDGKTWKPVTGAGGYGVAKDQFNTATFDAVKTDSVRVMVQLRKEVSGGILEMQVK